LWWIKEGVFSLSPNRPKNLNTDEREQLEALAEEMFNLHFLFWALRHRNRVDDPFDLTEPEFVTLDTLVRKGTCTVGEIQQVLDVRPAQMSRIIRALEKKSEKKLLHCAINPQDKRRINVTISDVGKKAHEEYRRRRIHSSMELLSGLSESEQTEVMKLIHRFHHIMSEKLRGKA
jgi:MarR family transcriptional regulator, 2-MHQ and catechol-resistance regulon repressor